MFSASLMPQFLKKKIFCTVCLSHIKAKISNSVASKKLDRFESFICEKNLISSAFEQMYCDCIILTPELKAIII